MKRTLALLAALLGAVSTFAATPPAQPNVLFILADDLGWADTTLYGHTKSHRMPNLRRLEPEPYSALQQGFDLDVPHHPGPGPAGSYGAPWKFKDFDHDPGACQS